MKKKYLLLFILSILLIIVYIFRENFAFEGLRSSSVSQNSTIWNETVSPYPSFTCTNNILREKRYEYRVALGQLQNAKKYIENQNCNKLIESLPPQMLACAKRKGSESEVHFQEDRDNFYKNNKCRTINDPLPSEVLICAHMKEYLTIKEDFTKNYDDCRLKLYNTGELQEINEVDKIMNIPFEEPKMEFITTDTDKSGTTEIEDYKDPDFSEPSKDPAITNIEGQKICWFEVGKWGTSDKIVPVGFYDIIKMQTGANLGGYYENKGLIYMDQILGFQDKEQAKKMNPQETYVYMRTGLYPWNSSKDGEVLHDIPKPSLYFALKTYAPGYRKWKIVREPNGSRNMEIIFHGCYGFGHPVPNF